MSISAASLVRKPGTETAAPRTARYAYPLLRAGQQTFQLVKIEDFKDEKYGKELYNFMKVRFGFIQVVAGWDAAEGNPVAEEKMRQKGHGHWFSIECHPICSKPGTNPQGEPTKPSNLYEILRVMLNDGDPLTDAQMGITDEAGLKEFMAAYNASATEKLTTLAEAKVYFAAETLMKLLGDLEAARPHVYGMLAQKVKADGTKYNKLTNVVAVLPPDEAEDYADYHPYAKPVDARTANDDESIVCADCGEQTHGYERRSDGAWVSNVEAAKQSEAKHGKVMCGRCIWKSNQAPF